MDLRFTHDEVMTGSGDLAPITPDRTHHVWTRLPRNCAWGRAGSEVVLVRRPGPLRGDFVAEWVERVRGYWDDKPECLDDARWMEEIAMNMVGLESEAMTTPEADAALGWLRSSFGPLLGDLAVCEGEGFEWDSVPWTAVASYRGDAMYRIFDLEKGPFYPLQFDTMMLVDGNPSRLRCGDNCSTVPCNTAAPNYLPRRY